MIIAASIVVGVGVAAVLFRLFFEDRDDFFECVRYYFTPDIISMFRGEWGEDWWGETKLMVYLILSGGSGFVTYFELHKFFG
jgi:hypothetical protein